MLPTGDKFYLGLALSQGTRKAVLPSLIAERERLLEYDLTRAIARVTTADKPVIGVMSPLGLEGDRMMAMRGMPILPTEFLATRAVSRHGRWPLPWSPSASAHPNWPGYGSFRVAR